MWNEVGQALRLAMTRMLDQLVNLLPGIMALIAALVVSSPDRVGYCGDPQAIARRL